MSATRTPALFAGHGSPMNAIEDNRWSRALRDLGASWPRPEAVLAISAHWYIPGTAVTANAHPPTIHDFGGFPRELYEVQYPAPGDPGLAREVAEALGGDSVPLSLEWGLDHGTWSVLCHLFPKADVPVVQVSVDLRAPPMKHVEIGRALAPFRDRGVMIFGTGNVTHNLGDAFRRMHTGDVTTPAWAADFDAAVVRALEAGDSEALARLIESAEGRKSHPTPDHYLPLLYVAGACEGEAPTFPIEGFDLGSLSMRSVRFG